MANLYVKAGSSNTAPYDTWAKAATSLSSAVTLASANDTIYVDSAFAETGLGNTTYAPAAGVRIISTSDTSTEPPTTANAGARVATTTTGSFTLSGGGWYGFVFQVGSGSSTATIALGSTDDTASSFESCTFTLITTGASAGFNLGVGSGSVANSELRTRNCTFNFASTNQGFNIRGKWQDEGSNLDGGSTHPTALFEVVSINTFVRLIGSDLSANTGTYWPAAALWYYVEMIGCRIGSGAIIQSALSVAESGEVLGLDCANGDQHYHLFHYNYRGNTVVSMSKYVTADGAAYDGSARHSWTVTGENGTFAHPYYSPWVDRYTSNLASVTPYFELARDGSATKYNDDQVWAEFAAKTNSGNPKLSFASDRRGWTASAAAQADGAGTGAWTGLGGTAASMKADSGSAISIAEIGYIRGRIAVVGGITVQMDPLIRGLAAESTSVQRVSPGGFMQQAVTASGGGMLVHPGMTGRMAA